MDNEGQWIRTHCTRMDHGGCGLVVKVKENRIIKIVPDPQAHFSRGHICAKGIFGVEKLNHPQRLKNPLLREGKRGEGRFRPISWDQALEIICENFRKIKGQEGAQGVAFCQGAPKGLEHFVLIRLANLFGSPNVVTIQDVCHAPREITSSHICGFYPVPDLENQAQLILVWGSNILHTNEEGSFGKILKGQIKRGARLIVIDPCKGPLAGHAQYYLQIRPGADLLLAIGFLKVIIEEGLYDKEFVAQWCNGFDFLQEQVKGVVLRDIAKVTRISEELIVASARAYALARPAMILWGNALEQTVYNFNTIASLVCLMAITGNLDIPGGNVHALDPVTLRPGEFVKAGIFREKARLMLNSFFHTVPRFMTVPPAFFKKAVLEGKPYGIKAAYFQCTNPLITWPESPSTKEALERLDFVVVSDVFMTPTALFADIVLPAATQFEFNDINQYGLGHGRIIASKKLVDPPLQCWPDIKILNELGKRLTNPDHWYEHWEGLLDELLSPAKMSYTEFAEKGFLTGPKEYQKYKNGGFKTKSGKVELLTGIPTREDIEKIIREMTLEDSDTEFPLIFTSKKEAYFLHSSYRWIQSLRRLSSKARILIHPETAIECGVRQGMEVFVVTKNGKAAFVVEVQDGVLPRIIVGFHGWWYPELGMEKGYGWDLSNINCLTSLSKLGTAFGTPQLRGIPCRIEKRENRGQID